MLNNLLIATGLSMDSFAVSVASGTLIKQSKLKNAARIAFVLAFFQGLMPVLGWFAGKEATQYICDYDHWAAFALLTLISGKMLYEALKTDENNKKNFNPLKITVLIGLGIATSIDALIVGVSLAFVGVDILLPALIIGLVTFIFSFSGVWFSLWISKRINNKIEILGSIVLFAIGLKILLEHTIFSGGTTFH